MTETQKLQQFLDNLTPEQKQQIANATAEDWMTAAAACVQTPEFWQNMGTAFLEGVAQGLADALNNR
jgi:hypothetical protein